MYNFTIQLIDTAFNYRLYTPDLLQIMGFPYQINYITTPSPKPVSISMPASIPYIYSY